MIPWWWIPVTAFYSVYACGVGLHFWLIRPMAELLGLDARIIPRRKRARDGGAA